MNHASVIVSPYNGTVIDIKVKQGSIVNESDIIFTIKTKSEHLYFIKMEAPGTITSIEVEVGDEVIPGMVLAYMSEHNILL